MYTVNEINVIIQSYKLLYGENPNMEYLTSELSSWITKSLYRIKDNPMTRPLAVTILLSKYDYDHKKTILCQVDNTGYISEPINSIVGGCITSNENSQILKIINEKNNHSLIDQRKYLSEKIQDIVNILEDNHNDNHYEICVINKDYNKSIMFTSDDERKDQIINKLINDSIT